MKQSDGITPQEQQRRREIFERARLLVESEGLKVPASTLDQGQRYIAGEIEIEDALQQCSLKQ
jgi:hypothetical protein